MSKIFYKRKLFLNLLILFFFLNSCTTDKEKEIKEKQFEPSAYNRARDHADNNPIILFGKDKDKNTNFEFNTSNILWRASLKTLDFIPLATVDYSGGIIITDWYSEGKSNKEQIKIQIRFFSTELRSESIQVISYKKICETNNECSNIAGNENFNREKIWSLILPDKIKSKKIKKNKA